MLVVLVSVVMEIVREQFLLLVQVVMDEVQEEGVLHVKKENLKKSR